MAHFISLLNLPSIRETVEAVLSHFPDPPGHWFWPGSAVRQFIIHFWRELCKLLGPSVNLSSGFHPQANRLMERYKQEMELVLQCITSQNPSSWSWHLLWVEYTYNSLPVSSMGVFLFQGVYGYQHYALPGLENGFFSPFNPHRGSQMSPPGGKLGWFLFRLTPGTRGQ